jgi:hypothetical protein
MLDKKMASRLKPVVNNPQVWEALESHLQELMQEIHQALVAAQSEQEMFRNQGKAILLGQLRSLRDVVNNFEKNN